MEGPTKYDNNVGERYLRLYGLLNSAYMQFVSCQELYRIYKIDSFDQFLQEARTMKILKARHSAASHSVNFHMNGIKDFYKVSQQSVRGFGEQLHIIGEHDNEYEINIKKELEIFTTFIQTELNKISRGILTRLFPPESKFHQETIKELYVLEQHSKGAIVIRGFKGKTIIAS